MVLRRRRGATRRAECMARLVPRITVAQVVTAQAPMSLRVLPSGTLANAGTLSAATTCSPQPRQQRSGGQRASDHQKKRATALPCTLPSRWRPQACAGPRSCSAPHRARYGALGGAYVARAARPQ